MIETLTYILKQIVDHPEELSIREQVQDSRTIYMIHCNTLDIGKIIGKQGRIIRAIRDIAKLIATKHNLYIDVAIAEEESNPINTT